MPQAVGGAKFTVKLIRCLLACKLGGALIIKIFVICNKYNLYNRNCYYDSVVEVVSSSMECSSVEKPDM